MKKLSKKMSTRIEALAANLADQNIDEVVLALKRGVATYVIQDLYELDADAAEAIGRTFLNRSSPNDRDYVRSEGAGALAYEAGIDIGNALLCEKLVVEVLDPDGTGKSHSAADTKKPTFGGLPTCRGEYGLRLAMYPTWFMPPQPMT